MPTVKMPSGEIIKFPDFMSPDDINTAIETEIKPQFEQRGRNVLEHIRTLKPDSPVIGDRDEMIKALSWIDDPAAMYARDMLNQGMTVDEIHREFKGGYDPIATTASQVGRPAFEATGLALGELAGAPAGPVGMVAGPALGYAAGSNFADIFDTMLGLGKKSSVKKELTELPGELGTGAGISMSGPIIGKAGQKMLGPFAGKMSEEARRLAQVAREQKMPLSPSKIFPSKTSRAFEWLSKAPPFGVFMKSRQARQLSEGLMRMHDDALGKLPIRADKYEAGEKLAEALKGAKKTLQWQTKDAYRAFESGIEGSVNMSKTAALIKQAKEGVSGELREALEIASRNGENWSPSMVNNFQKRIWSLTWKKDPGLGKKLTQAVKDDVGPGLTGLLENAKGKWQMLETFDKNLTVKRISKKYATAPDEVIWAAFRSGNIKDVNIIKDAVDKETWDVARSRFVENLFDTATDTSGQTAVFKPAEFVKLMNKYDRQIKNVMPEIHGNLRDFTALTRAAIDDISRAEKPTLFQKSIATLGLGGVSTAAYFEPSLIVPATFPAMMAKSLTNPKGWMKKWLTTGILQGEGARQVMTQGARTAIMEGADND